MKKVIRTYEVENVSGVARFLNNANMIFEFAKDPKVDAADAIIDMKNAIQRADLANDEKAAVAMVVNGGAFLEGEEKRAFFNACAKIAAVFAADGYGPMRIMRYAR